MMAERWLPIPGFEGLYEVSDEGAVRRYSQPRVGNVLERLAVPVLVTPKRGPAGYLAVTLTRDAQKRRFYIHCLVLMAFVGLRPPKHTGSHLDGTRDNNRLPNLVWETQRENVARKDEHGTAQTGERSPSAKLTAEQVLEIRANAAVSKKAADRYGVTASLVRQIRRRVVWKHV